MAKTSFTYIVQFTKRSAAKSSLGDVCTLSAQALKKFLSHKSFLDKFFIGIQDFRDKVPNCETRIIIRSSSQGYLLRGIDNCLVEWPMLWRITINSLHNEGIYK